MVKIDNALGKKIQITNSKIYSELSNKIDPITNLDYESLLNTVGDLAFNLSKHVDADSEKTMFYVSLYALGCIDGGKETLNYFNKNAQKQISQSDIMMHNFKKIFSNITEKFTMEQLNEFSQLYSLSSASKEIQVLKIAEFLETIAQIYRNKYNYNDEQAANFVFDEIRKITDHYKTTGQIGISSEAYNLFKNIEFSKYVFDQERINKLGDIISKYNINLNKEQCIEEMNCLKSEKKNKIR